MGLAKYELIPLIWVWCRFSVSFPLSKRWLDKAHKLNGEEIQLSWLEGKKKWANTSPDPWLWNSGPIPCFANRNVANAKDVPSSSLFHRFQADSSAQRDQSLEQRPWRVENSPSLIVWLTKSHHLVLFLVSLFRVCVTGGSHELQSGHCLADATPQASIKLRIQNYSGVLYVYRCAPFFFRRHAGWEYAYGVMHDGLCSSTRSTSYMLQLYIYLCMNQNNLKIK